MARALGRPMTVQAVKSRLAEVFAATFGYQAGTLSEETLWNMRGLTADSPNSLSR